MLSVLKMHHSHVHPGFKCTGGRCGMSHSALFAFFWFAYTDPHPQKPNHPPLFLMFCNYSKANKQAKATNISVIVVSVVITGNLQEPETGYTQVLEIHVQ